jgi:hypothetical protein
MEPNELEEMVEKNLQSGETLTMHIEKGTYVVECWDKNGNSRWHKLFLMYENAEAEFDRWN